eukprot:415530-Pyramimonas_sp.AAC.1
MRCAPFAVARVVKAAGDGVEVQAGGAVEVVAGAGVELVSAPPRQESGHRVRTQRQDIESGHSVRTQREDTA